MCPTICITQKGKCTLRNHITSLLIARGILAFFILSFNSFHTG